MSEEDVERYGYPFRFQDVFPDESRRNVDEDVENGTAVSVQGSDVTYSESAQLLALSSRAELSQVRAASRRHAFLPGLGPQAPRNEPRLHDSEAASVSGTSRTTTTSRRLHGRIGFGSGYVAPYFPRPTMSQADLLETPLDEFPLSRRRRAERARAAFRAGTSQV